MRRAVVLIFLATVLSGCSEPLEFAAWTIPVPEGTRIIEHEVLPLDEREAPPVELREDLVLGRAGTDADLTFYGPARIAVADDGRMFVLDPGNDRVVVFGPDGDHLMTLGRTGQGPGEFMLQASQSIAITKDRLRVDDRGNNRLSIWTLDGDFLETRPTPMGALRIHFFAGLPDGTRIAFTTERNEDRSETEVIAVFDDDNSVVWRVGQHPRFPRLRSKRHDYTMRILDPSLRYATARDGRIYLKDGEQYQILALQPSGEAEWALRVPYPPNPYPEEYKEWIVGLRRENPRVSDLRVSDFDWPGRWPALRYALVDGHGHLYVVSLTYPLIRDDYYPVDVFSRDGELLYSGTIEGASRLWEAALGDYVYGIQEAESGDMLVVRYRLVEPFE